MMPEIPYYLYAVLGLSAAGITYGLTIVLIKVMPRLGVMDLPDERKIHREPVPKLGGLALFAAIAVCLALACAISPMARHVLLQPRSIAVFAGLCVMLGLGIYDDLFRASWLTKFVFQMVAAAIVIRQGVIIQKVTNPFGPTIELGRFSIYWTFIWLIGITNAVNLSDGLDGLATGIVSIVSGVTFAITLNLMHTRPEQYELFVFAAVTSIVLLGSSLAFLRFNFFPARIFLGDTGSLVLGFMIACTAVISSQISSTTVALVVPVIALGLPILDTVLAILRRTARRRNPFQADREHIHHKIMQSGISHPETVLILYGFCILLGVAALVLAFKKNQYAGVVLFVLLLVTLFGFRKFGILDVTRLWGIGKKSPRERQKGGTPRQEPRK
ncbi:undecaprenyl/decaprenyl-phosphate alpha-N-acetylglucosaminyl 1-phosphate transferase [bacterium]|nr:undecaprenyl/decaprenyl-phosphate alpha-N-acetylglucosaminyl 1-phosphate transferase [bacterium]